MRRRGVRVWFVCNDTLPLDHPEWFRAAVHESFQAWLRTVATVADGVACISRATEAGLRQWLDAWHVQRERPLTLACFALGADIEPFAPGTARLADEESALLKRLHKKPTFLMVGTLEPRKGHAQTLEAFNLLWARGDDVGLVIVGLPGWMTDIVQRRIRHHDEFGQRLFWFMGASDAMLERLYATCTLLLAPSEGEGFGLPLIEAARHGLPILCRDLPVFREVAGEHATYFSGHDAESLARAIRAWLGKWQARTAPVTRGMQWITWAESARQLVGLVLGSSKNRA
ncbi:MAG TPA: glycosyltransferase family 1 protein [Rhodanobacteraceae bacterium]|nr:glycosyltransferase family 1 protein [Rhodanobacteraceae bacterium]